MSSQPPPRSSHSRRESLSRVFSRLKRSMTRRSSRTEKPAEQAPVTPTKSAPKPSETPAPSAVPSRGIGPEILEIDDRLPESTAEAPPRDVNVPSHRHQSAQTRLVMLGDEFGINVQELGLELHPEGPRPGVSRVEKRIRMRVRYACHNCETRFGPSKVCRKCDHTRCGDCPRDPPKKSRERSDQLAYFRESPSRNTEAHSDPLLRVSQTSSPIIQRSSQPPGMPVQRVLYTCHECESPFILGTAHYCANCGHQRCSQCSRQLARPVEPPKNLQQIITLAPESSERQQRRRVWKMPRQRIRWACHECQAKFQQGSNTCINCKHTRCDSCPRAPSRANRAEVSRPLVGATV